MNKNIVKLLGFILLIIIVVMLFDKYHLSRYLGISGFNYYHDQILNLKEEYPVEFMVIYVVSYILLIAAFIPGTIIMDLLAGFIYGPYWGTVVVVFSYLLGATSNFILIRYFFYDVFHRKFSYLRDVVPIGKASSSIVLDFIGLRFIPVIPFWMINILAAILEVPLWLFTLTTFIGIIPSSVIYVFIGTNVRGQISEETFLQPKLWVPLLILATMTLLPNVIKIYRKWRSR